VRALGRPDADVPAQRDVAVADRVLVTAEAQESDLEAVGLDPVDLFTIETASGRTELRARLSSSRPIVAVRTEGMTTSRVTGGMPFPIKCLP
jgi:hypothetical protein